ncbi:MAG: hypothetical protein J6B85_01650, partial [Lachnospiraceae bacterium]|nr:hypothetical protein [Lachnospiraceae bacterium]
MKTKIQKWLPAVLALILCAAFGAILTIYINPMENVSLNLSLTPEGEALSPGDFDEKGWTVYTQEGDTMTELEPDGYGGYWGIELGQTFYFSRVMEEDLDSPTLQISTAEYTFSVFLDDILLYTDCPDLD